MSRRMFQKVFWEKPGSVWVFLQQDWTGDLLDLPIVIDERRYTCQWRRAGREDVAALTGYFQDGNEVVFFLDSEVYPEADNEDAYYVAGSFNGWGAAVGDSRYALVRCGKESDGVRQCRVPVNEVQAESEVRFRFVSASGQWLRLSRRVPNWVSNPFGAGDFLWNPEQTGLHAFQLLLDPAIPIGRFLHLLWKEDGFQERTVVSPSEYFLSLKSDKEMGAIPGQDSTIFRLFAPRAVRVEVSLSKDGSFGDRELFSMGVDENGVWEVCVPGGWEGSSYAFHVDGINSDASTYFDYAFPVVDPYALSMVSPSGPGLVVRRDSLRASSWTAPEWQDLVVVEIHLRDAIARVEGYGKNGTPLGFRDFARWIRSEDNYLVHLGVNAIELQPVQEFEYGHPGEYHWGYMPVNYFSLSSAYAENPAVADQMEAFADLVNACHERGIAVILDVVYNHLGEPNALYHIDKQYYFELDERGDPTNWSGVGNDLRASAPMATRLILDSLEHLVLAYGVDGFRFDLAELLGVGVLSAIESRLKQVKPSIILIAEPWSFRAHIGTELKATGFASWNDSFRDFFSRYLCGEGSPSDLAWFMRGSPGHFTRFPAQTVNYSESHDDHAWLDLITQNTGGDAQIPTQVDRWRQHLMLSILMVSLGVPMLSAGQDFLRTKRGIRNTYQRGDLNALDYDRLRQYSASHDYTVAWIRFRRSDHGRVLRLWESPGDSYFQTFEDSGSRALGVLFNADRSRDAARVFFAVNPSASVVSMRLEEGLLHGFRQWADHERWSFGGLGFPEFQIKKEWLVIPAYGCGLWVESHT